MINHYLFVLVVYSLTGLYWTSQMFLASCRSKSLLYLQVGKRGRMCLAGLIMSIMNPEEPSGKDQQLSMSYCILNPIQSTMIGKVLVVVEGQIRVT